MAPNLLRAEFNENIEAIGRAVSTSETQFRDPWLLGDVERVSSYCRMSSEMS